MKKRYIYPPLLCLLLGGGASAQYIQVNDTYTAQQLVNTLVDNSCAQISNISLSGSFGSRSHGYFSSGASGFPFANGIVLSTGFAASAPGPNNSLLSEGTAGSWEGDQDLEDALGVNNTINATVLEFDFIPFTDNISFDYMFSSEQYLTSITSQNQCNYTDGFAFLIKEAGSTGPYQNLAVVPGTDIPVKVNTVRGEGVCPSANEQYFGGFNGFEHPTNFNGQTVILKAQTAVIAGNLYHIKLVVADQGNNLYDSAIFLGGGSFKSTLDLGPDRLIATGNALCTGQTVTVNAANPMATGYQWYKNGVAVGGAISAQYTITSQGDYSVHVQLSPTCFFEGEIRVEYATLPLTGNFNLLQCDDNNDGIAAFNLNLANEDVTNNDTSLTVSYFTSADNANSNTNVITNPITFFNTPGEIVYARITNQYGCYVVSTVALLTSANGITNPDPITTCDEDSIDDGFTTVDLTQRSGQILQNLPAGLQLQYFTSAADALAAINPIAIPSAFVNTVMGGQTIYARVHNASECYAIAQLPVVVYTFGNALMDEKVILCKDDIITLDPGDGYSSYVWDNFPGLNMQTLTVKQPGNYRVTVTNDNGCTGSKIFMVVPSEPAIGAEIEINDFMGNQNSITVYPEGLGDYEYSMDGNHYQSSNVFGGLTAGKYTIYINDRNGCGEYKDGVYVLDYPKFFTPNNDGVNDIWKINYLVFLPQAQVTIYDRYGKIVSRFKGGAGWDGTYNGRPLTATDYWFVIEMETGRTVKGHFSLLR